ncbi:MAG: hypothetical protein LBR47_00300 [Spirochaetaceae bacterium]|nr:hypothetical protein [Spirochaetaceae bacterium]
MKEDCFTVKPGDVGKRWLPFFFAGLVTLLCADAAALPGIDSYLPDTSGEYVVYQDFSYAEETYFGFLFYDEETYGAFISTPEKGSTISLLFTVDPAAEDMVFTGERILSDISTQDDISAVNYLHDLLYELSRRRTEVTGRVLLSEVRESQEFPLFGGETVFVYDYYIPLFNLRRVEDTQGAVLLELVRMGQILADDDTDFYNFIPLPAEYEPYTPEFSVSGRAPAEVYYLDDMALSLDSQWMQSAQNIWFLGDAAMLWVDVISINPEFRARNGYSTQEYFVRRFSLSSLNKWGLVPEMRVFWNGDNLRLDNVFYNPQTNMETREIKVFTDLGNGLMTAKTLTVFESIYLNHSAYFDAIVEQ